jgi:hypothetical protein
MTDLPHGQGSGQLEAIRTGVNGRTIRITRASVDTHRHVPGQLGMPA